MSSMKPVVNLDLVRGTVDSYWGEPVTEFQVINQGELSQVYAFVHADKDYIIRLNPIVDGFLRDKWAYDLLRQQGVPVPRVLTIDTVENLHYAISERVPGQTLLQFTVEQNACLLPDMVELLLRIHHADVTSTTGYGWIDGTGNGEFGSWSAYLDSFFDGAQRGFWQGWTDLFSTSFLDAGLFRGLYDEMMDFAPACDGVRQLVHGDFHIGNLLADGRTMTGVIDWGNAKYGDGLYDVATFQFWTTELDLLDRYRALCDVRNIETPNFDMRVRCHMLALGLDALRFYAKADRREAYDFTRSRLRTLSEQSFS